MPFNGCDRLEIRTPFRGGVLAIEAEIKDYCVEHDLRDREIRIEDETLVVSNLTVVMTEKDGSKEAVLFNVTGSVEFVEGDVVQERICDALVEWEWENNPVDWDDEIAEREADFRLHMMREEGL